MRTVVSSTAFRLALCAVALCFAAVATVGCGDTVQAKSACSDLEYTKSGVARADFLPCAGEMIAALDEMAPLSQAAMKGSKQARLDGEAVLRRLIPMVAEAGGDRLLEPWGDRELSDLSSDIHNTVSRYRAFYALAIPPDYHPAAARARWEAQRELNLATRHYGNSRVQYRRLKGR